MGLNLRGESSGSVEINAPSSGGDVNITLPGQEGTLIIENSSGITSSTSMLVGSGVTITSGGIDMNVGVVTASSLVSSGNVAIGNVNPQQLLHVWPDTANTTSAFIRVTSGDRNSNTGIDLGSDADGDGRLNVVSNGNLKLYTNNDEKVRITSTGDVGIGTNNPTGSAALTNNTATLAVGVATVGALHVNGNAYPSSGPLSNRNLIINGDMRIAQRGTDLVTGSGEYAVDRFRQNSSTAAVITGIQTDTTPPGYEFAIRAENTSADGSVDASDLWCIQQFVEGNNIQHLNWGTADAVDVTVSFWVRSTQTGTFCFVILGAADGTTIDKSYVSEYTINSADTWEHKSITVPGPTSGTAWHTGNNRGLGIRFGLSAGTDEQQDAGSWGTVNASGSSNQTQLITTANSEFYLTGVQLEVGTVATPFERRGFGDELGRCQRYFHKSFNQDTAPAQNAGNPGGAGFISCYVGAHEITYFYPVPLRATPTTVTTFSPNAATSNWATNGDSPSASISVSGEGRCTIRATSPAASGRFYWIHLTADAEL